jgi:hypothetical protein
VQQELEEIERAKADKEAAARSARLKKEIDEKRSDVLFFLSFHESVVIIYFLLHRRKRLKSNAEKERSGRRTSFA